MIKCTDKEFIIDYLRKEDEIANLNIIGVINNLKKSLFNNPADELEIFVDNLEKPNYVMVREHEYWHYIYSRDDKYIEILKEEYFIEKKEYGFSAVDPKTFKLISEGREVEWKEECKLLYLDKENFKSNESSLDICSCTLEDAEEINDLYTFKDEISIEFIKDNISNRPSSMYKENNKLVSWVLVHRDNSIGIMYTKKEHRGKGLAYELSMDLLEKIINKDQIPYIHIGIENEASFKLAAKCGFKGYKNIIWFGIK